MSEEIPTSERLARALEERQNARLAGIIQRAREGYYDDFRSPVDDPMSRLVRDLRQNGEHEFAGRVIAGEFAGTPAEADAWVKSREGQATFRKFMGQEPKPTAEPAGRIEIGSMVAFRNRQPYVTLKWGSESGQFTPAEARGHAAEILEASQAAVADAFLWAFLVEKIGADDATAAAAMEAFRGYRKALEERGHA